MRIKLLALVALIAAVTAAYFLLKPVVLPGEPPEEPCVGDDCGPQGPSAEQRLAERYAPVVYLADQVTDCNDKTGDFKPVPVDIVLGNSQVALFQGRDGQPKAGPTAADLYDGGEEYYLDLPGNPRRPGCRYVRDGHALEASQPAVAYARVTNEDGYDELVLQYWLYYYFNQWNNKHESDWEMIQIVFDAGSAQDALGREPLRVGFSQHSSGELAEWDDDKLEKEGDRPVLRIAAGSHSNRYTPKTFLGRGEQGFGCDEAEGTTRVSLEARLIPDTISGPTDPFAWLTFKGRWGELAGPEFDGPTGPNMKKQWDQPLTWEEDLRTSSVRLPSRESIGPSAINAFCDIVALGSNIILPVYLELPRLVFAGVGLFAVGMVVSLTRTRYIPARREPLRVRRRLGQILLSSFAIYTRNARLFIGIGLVFLPVALSVSVIHWLLLSVSPVDPIVDLPRADLGPDIVIAFALSELQFGIAYATVLIACTAALAAVDQSQPTGVRLAYTRVWENIKKLVPPRLFAYAAVSVLTLTVVGIPLAVRQSVRWTFVEQAILFDGAGPRESLRVSDEAVARGFWWAAGATIALSAIGLFLAPAVGILLILLAQSIPLADVNVITSVIHVALVPFVAIAYALIYFELRGRE
ncbi:MAG: hypothetical protein AB7T32_16305 [Dehalococcoidia bacterium]